MANFAVTRFDDDYEEEANRKLVPQFKELREKLKNKIGQEVNQKKDKIENEID